MSKKNTDAKVGHRWWTPKRQGWLTFCWRCGLMSLKNEATQKAVSAGCFKEEHVVEDIEKSK